MRPASLKLTNMGQEQTHGRKTQSYECTFFVECTQLRLRNAGQGVRGFGSCAGDKIESYMIDKAMISLSIVEMSLH